jgi:hypothetical protein
VALGHAIPRLAWFSYYVICSTPPERSVNHKGCDGGERGSIATTRRSKGGEKEEDESEHL